MIGLAVFGQTQDTLNARMLGGGAGPGVRSVHEMALPTGVEPVFQD